MDLKVARISQRGWTSAFRRNLADDDPAASEEPNPDGRRPVRIQSAVVIEQTFWNVSVRLLTAESSSMSEVVSLRSHGKIREQRPLTYTYRNESRQELSPRSTAHRGACELTVVRRLLKRVSGTYSTDRFTVGDMDLEFIDRRKDRVSLADVRAALWARPRSRQLAAQMSCDRSVQRSKWRRRSASVARCRSPRLWLGVVRGLPLFPA